MDKYNHKEIEQKWQKKWKELELYKTGMDGKKPKYYILDMFPYPSGVGLHVGHPKGYIATDIFARMKMMKGFNVLHPMGWDAFGLPAENYAIKNKIHPRIAVEKNIEVFKFQLEKLGFSYDWEREINTADPKFFKWTQWAFIQMFKKGLAYESYEPINWCHSCKTGFANEDLEDGKCERCGSEIEQKPMRQWVLKITDYAERMLNDLEKLAEWDESIKEMQKNWIGKSEGAEVDFEINGEKVTVFTTRPDTLFGATYFVLSPEHPIIENHKSQITNYEEVEEYIEKSRKKTQMERTDLAKEKTGVKLEGLMATNPANNQKIPVFIADYVLMGYGTGAIMAVPAHDERDYEFAKKYNLPIKTVVTSDKSNVIGIGAMIEVKDGKFLFQRRDKNTDRNPGMLSFFGGGIENDESTIKTLKREMKEELNLDIIDNYVLLNKLETQKFPGKYLDIYYIDNINEQKIKLGEGEAVERLKLSEALNRDDVTLFTKRVIKYFQENKCFIDNGVNINSDFLDGLETKKAKQKMIEWLEEKGLGKKAVNYKIQDWVFSRQRYWGEPIPMVHCDDCGVVPVPEEDLPVTLPEVKNYEPTGTGESPLANITDWVNTTCPKCKGPARRETNTMPQWAGSSWYFLRYIDPDNDKELISKEKDKYWSPVDFYVGGAEHATRHLIYARFWHKFLFDIGVVNYEEPFKRLQHVGLISGEDGRKMSKRWGNVINPDDIVEKYGADAMRVYEMFMGPFSQGCAWSTNGLIGARKFLDKVWKLKLKAGNKKLEVRNIDNLLHKTIKKVGEDIEGFKLNTAVSAMMILVNNFEKENEIPEEFYKMFLIVLSPFAPHMAEELWHELGHKESIFKESWPEYDPELARDEEIELVLQVNGKVRDRILVSADISEEEAKKIAQESEKTKKWIEGKNIIKIVFVKGKLVNIVVK